MSALTTSISVIWIAFWLYWLVVAAGAKRSVKTNRVLAPRLVFIAIAVLLLRGFNPPALHVTSPVLGAVGAALLLAGLGLAVWARIYLGRNWGMPMTQRAEPELVTSGPYAHVRHPIYSGLLLAMIGTALATNLFWLVGVGVFSAYFIYSATVEERNLAATFPTTYPSYRKRTHMLVPLRLTPGS
jgi:protein-S-isoprenylcysteine O-methyltransferase Ste14